MKKGVVKKTCCLLTAWRVLNDFRSAESAEKIRLRLLTLKLNMARIWNRYR
jgi:hypothetical protein